ncbi:hypothetical protein JCM10213_007846 [Rhodosporidiobolus nylandii]
MDAPPPTPSPPSLLALTHTLHTLLSPLASLPPPSSSSSPAATTPPAEALLHPLGPHSSASPAALAALRGRIRKTMGEVRRGVGEFAALSLASTGVGDAAVGGGTAGAGAGEAAEKQRRDKYLTLLRDASSSESALLSLSSSSSSSSSALSTLIHRRTQYASLFPALTPSEAASPPGSGAGTLATLERLAAQLGLVSFRDDDGLDAAAAERVTLSLGGKVMVVDFEIERSSSSGEKVDKVKVAYVAPSSGEDRVCRPAAEALQRALSLPPSASSSSSSAGAEEQEEAERDAGEHRWKSVRGLLSELKELDESTSRTGEDCFALLCEEIVPSLFSSFASPPPSSSSPSPSSSSPKSSPQLLPHPTSLTPLLLLSATPSAALSRSLAAFLAAPSAHTLPRAEGVHAARVTLACLEDGGDECGAKSEGQGEGEKKGEGQGEKEEKAKFVAVLDPPIPISAATGRRVCEALGLPLPPPALPETEEPARRGKAGGTAAGRGVGLAELLLLPRPSSSASASGSAAAAAAATNTGERVWNLSFPSDPTLHLSLRVPPIPSLGSSPTSPAFLATHLRFTHPPQLKTALELLDAQVRVNELVRGVCRDGVERLGGAEGPGKGEGRDEGGRRRKKRRVGEKKDGAGEGGADGEISLEDLVSDPPTPPPLPVYLTLPPSSPSSSSPLYPSLTLSFPLPSLPPSSAVPMSLHLTALPSPSQLWEVTLDPHAPADIRERLDARAEGGRVERLEKVLELTGSVGLVVRWVVRRLKGEGGGGGA